VGPLVSVVIPTYNHAHYLGRALESVINQSYKNFEIIVIDNNSTDNTKKIIESFENQKIKVILINNNGIIAASRNIGIKEANGEWIAFLDSDDWWMNNKLELCLKNTKNIDVFYHDLAIVREKKVGLRKKKLDSREMKSPVLLDLLKKGNAIANSSAIVRRNILFKAGLLDESPGIVGSEDYNLWLRVAKITERFQYIKMILGHYQLHYSNMSNKDMSISWMNANSDFINCVPVYEQNIIKSKIFYLSGRHAFNNKKYEISKEKLKYVIKFGGLKNKVKSLIMIMIIKLIKKN